MDSNDRNSSPNKSNRLQAASYDADHDSKMNDLENASSQNKEITYESSPNRETKIICCFNEKHSEQINDLVAKGYAELLNYLDTEHPVFIGIAALLSLVVVVCGAFVFFIFTGALNNSYSEETLNLMAEVNYQLLNGVFTGVCAYVFPSRMIHLFNYTVVTNGYMSMLKRQKYYKDLAFSFPWAIPSHSSELIFPDKVEGVWTISKSVYADAKVVVDDRYDNRLQTPFERSIGPNDTTPVHIENQTPFRSSTSSISNESSTDQPDKVRPLKDSLNSVKSTGLRSSQMSRKSSLGRVLSIEFVPDIPNPFERRFDLKRDALSKLDLDEDKAVKIWVIRWYTLFWFIVLGVLHCLIQGLVTVFMWTYNRQERPWYFVAIVTPAICLGIGMGIWEGYLKNLTRLP